jgi:hypothetical protein
MNDKFSKSVLLGRLAPFELERLTDSRTNDPGKDNPDN